MSIDSSSGRVRIVGHNPPTTRILTENTIDQRKVSEGNLNVDDQ